MLRHWRNLDRVAGFVHSSQWAYWSFPVSCFLVPCDSIWIRVWRSLGDPCRFSPRQIGRKRGFDFSDVELRRDSYFAVHGVRAVESSRESSGDAAPAANYLVTFHPTRNASACRDCDCARCRWFGMDAAAKNASGIRTDRVGLESAG